MSNFSDLLRQDPVLLAFCALIIGVILDQVIRFIGERIRFAKELKDNSHIDASGVWYAIWQTSIGGKEKLNGEAVKIKQKGQVVKMWNTEKSSEGDGGYFWTSQLRFLHGKSLMGWYFPKKKELNDSSGMVFYTFYAARKVFYGKWVGTAYDGNLQTGLAVIARDKEQAEHAMSSLQKIYPNKVQIIGDNIVEHDLVSITPPDVNPNKATKQVGANNA